MAYSVAEVRRSCTSPGPEQLLAGSADGEDLPATGLRLTGETAVAEPEDHPAEGCQRGVPPGVPLTCFRAAVEGRAVEFHGDLELGDRGVQVDRAERQGHWVLLHEARHPRGLEDLADAPDLELALAALH